MPQITISAAESGRSVLDVLRARLGLSAERARQLVHKHQVRLGGRLCREASWRVRRGQCLEVQQTKPQPGGTSQPRICYADDQIVVVDKPSGLTTMRHPEEAAEFGPRGRHFLPPTLADLLPGLLTERTKKKPGPVWAVHRLDRDTSGLVIFARTKTAERHLGQQFRVHTIERGYLALVRGRAHSARIESYLVPDRGDGRRGSGQDSTQGKLAVTQVQVREDLGAYSLVECRLETGRTHQVRIHLGEAGTPICGERVYDRSLHGRPLPDASGAPRLALHAATLGVTHPTTGKRLIWHAPLPKDLAQLLAKLRKERPRPSATEPLQGEDRPRGQGR
jgi:23S rRNA pseudouridine1911/1915/1917 synthase